jgi:hypothetical protein
VEVVKALLFGAELALEFAASLFEKMRDGYSERLVPIRRRTITATEHQGKDCAYSVEHRPGFPSRAAHSQMPHHG